jgi:hypothetical protein
MDQCVAAEKQVAPIRKDMENVIHNIDPVADSDLLIDRFGIVCFTGALSFFIVFCSGSRLEMFRLMICHLKKLPVKLEKSLE